MESLHVYFEPIGVQRYCRRAVRRVKEGASAVLLQSDLNESWWSDSMECYTYLRNIQDLLSDGKTPYEGRFGKSFNGPIIPFGTMDEYLFISAEDLSRLHQFDPKVLSSIFLGCVLSAKGIGKGDIKVADIEELEEMDVSELQIRRLNIKEVLTTLKDEIFLLSIVDRTIKISWGDQDLRLSLIMISPDRGEEQDNLGRESDGASSTPRQDWSWYDDEVQNDFLSISGDFMYCHYESNCTCRLKNLSLFHWNTLTLSELQTQR